MAKAARKEISLLTVFTTKEALARFSHLTNKFSKLSCVVSVFYSNMIGITGVCSRLVQALGVSGLNSSSTLTCKKQEDTHQADDDLMIRALTAVFDMDNKGKIKKEKARRVVEKLGLIYAEGVDANKSSFDLPGGVDDEEVLVEEVLSGLEDGSDRHQLLEEVFKIFDENGNGYIEAMELKRVLQCLGLDKGWDMDQIQKMLKAADLNLDGKVDFSEFELMMGS